MSRTLSGQTGNSDRDSHPTYIRLTTAQRAALKDAADKERRTVAAQVQWVVDRWMEEAA